MFAQDRPPLELIHRWYTVGAMPQTVRGCWYSGWEVLNLVGGLEHECYFSIWECHHPNWRTPSFFRGVGQPPTRNGHLAQGFPRISQRTGNPKELRFIEDHQARVGHGKKPWHSAQKGWVDGHPKMLIYMSHLNGKIWFICAIFMGRYGKGI